MRIDIGKSPIHYGAGLVTVLSSIFSFKVGVEIGAGPISLLVHFVSLCLLILGALLIRRAFKKAESDYTEDVRRYQREVAKRSEEKQKNSETQAKA